MYRASLLLLFALLFLLAPRAAHAHGRTSLVSYTFVTDDCDSDGLSDEVEEQMGLEPCTADTDGDSLTDFQEVRTYNSDPRMRDSDTDGLPDAAEALQYRTNPRAADTDNDALTDSTELFVTRTLPAAFDTDNDSLADGEEVGRFGSNPLAADTDNDGLNDGPEVYTWRTDPKAPDTDGDGLGDRDELLLYHTDPTDSDIDHDGVADGAVIFQARSDPRIADTDNDSIPDGRDNCPILPGLRERNGCPAPPKLGASAAFSDILFPAESAVIDTNDPITARALDRMVAFMRQCRDLSVIIEGYASGPSEKTNLEVSEARARRAEAWLVTHGIDRNRIELAIGYGGRKGEAAMPVKDTRGTDIGTRAARTIILRVARACEP